MPAKQAGSHPFTVTFALGLEYSGEETAAPLRDLRLDAPPGVVASASVTPRCVAGDLLDEGDCRDATAVGVAASSSEPGEWETRPVFQLTTPEGEGGAPIWLGFELASGDPAIAKVGIARPPQNLYLELTDIPESADPFGLVLQLWGVPADPAHDLLRGTCGVGSKAHPADAVASFEFDGSLGVCPAAAAEAPLLTLPTSCEGPAESSYAVHSWEGGWDSGVFYSPVLFGCGTLAFEPFASAEQTSAAAGSPTGFHLSLDFDDEGLTYSDGIAQSQVRDLVVDLPAGMSVDPSPAATCSETQILDQLMVPGLGDGCPAGSAVGSLKAETPLLEGRVVAGAVYRAAAGASPAEVTLYAVLKDADLGIAILRLVEIEPDPGTDRLVAYAEDLPRLPFSHLGLNLHGGPDALLVNPPRCGEYETRIELTPWADGNVAYSIPFAAGVDSGPGGGPCPSDDEGGESPSDGPPPIQALPAAPILGPVFVCPRGRRAIRRHGVRRCVRRCPKWKRRARRGGRVRCVRRCRRGERLVRRKGKPRCVKRGRKGAKRRRDGRRR